jgi:hypothetical protein
MNRREFLGASIVSLIAALCLPFERFAEWMTELFGEPRPPFWGVNRSLYPETLTGLRLTADNFSEMLRKAYSKDELGFVYASPPIFGQLKAQFNA